MTTIPPSTSFPTRPTLSAQYLLLYTLSSRDEDLKDRIDVDNRWTRLSARVRAQPSTDTLAMGERVRRFIRERYPETRGQRHRQDPALHGDAGGLGG